MRIRANVRKLTGACDHRYAHFKDDGRLVPDGPILGFAYVEIYPDNGGWYIDYFDKDGHWLTDGWHETLELAKQQAEFEFEIRKEDWVEVPDPPP